MRKDIEKYINEKYKQLQEHPWKEYPEYSTFKHKDNGKWFALIMDVPYEKLGINKEGRADVINVKHFPELIGSARKEEGVLPAYHMNKEYWLTILLDGTVPKERIYELIDISYGLTMKKSKGKK